MSHTGLAAFDSTLQTTNIWLNELMEEMGWQDRHLAYQAMRTVLHAVRDRLTIEEVADLASQLPMLVRGFFYEGWKPSGKPLKERHRAEFLAPIAATFHDHPEIAPEGVVWGVFKVLQRHVSPGEIRDVKHLLPEDLRALLP
jgi:uncharacterized protein (DUF2267 family)